MELKLKQLPLSLEKIVRDIKQHEKTITSQLAQKIIANAEVELEQIEKWQDYDHPLANSYGRKLVYKEDFFEIMVMSWVEGDISAIHDHGYTTWGAVQIFGEAEHATFKLKNNFLTMLSCQKVKPGTIIPVSHNLIHQMGNSTEKRFLSLHVYGCSKCLSLKSVTAEARIFNATDGVIQRTDGGVFYGLPQTQINAVEPGLKTDYVSWLRNTTEYIRRIQKVNQQKNQQLDKNEKKLVAKLFDAKHWLPLRQELIQKIDQEGNIINPQYFQLIRGEMLKAFFIQSDLQKLESQKPEAYTNSYAKIYDELYGRKHLERFVSKYFQFFSKHYNFDFSGAKILSLGCGTGIVEEYLIKKYNLNPANILGVDKSKAMIQIASKRIKAITKDILQFEATDNIWNLALATINVFQYLPQSKIEESLGRTVQNLQNGGYLIADFVLGEHFPRYPKIVTSKQVISLQQPSFIEENGYLVQQNEIVNVRLEKQKLIYTHQKEPAYFLNSLGQIKSMFENFFGYFEIFDAATLEPLKYQAETCLPNRCLVIAQKC
jgi:predicted metal-dependent enzyme (double-stranded beta helix superfamily)/SAM-dependent methyltransferase